MAHDETLDYTYVSDRPMHLGRAKQIYSAHPQVKALMGNNPWTALWVVALVSFQLVMAWLLRDAWWVWVPVVAWLVGAFVNHALYVLNHECTHNLVFRRPLWNNLLGISCDFALVTPSAMAFRKYHLLHHQLLGQYDEDMDVASRQEGRIVGNSSWRKAIWVAMLGISQASRPLRAGRSPLFDKWIMLNVAMVVAVDVAIYLLMGPLAIAYLLLSTLFALGLHPVGGRWIQEHYVTSGEQETYSYYGPLNRTCFNVGYHVEHHDFANVPWNNLPKLTRLAPEFYDGLVSYRSWTALLVRFILDPTLSIFSRILRSPKPETAAER